MLDMIENKTIKVEKLNTKLDFGRPDFGMPEISDAGWRSVGILGLFDKGKTHMLNGLFCMALPSGKDQTTEGLSLIFDAEYSSEVQPLTGKPKGYYNQWLVIDSAGFQATVNFDGINEKLQLEERKNEEMRIIAEQIVYEDFVFDLVSHTSQIAIFVVNELTWLEQKQIFNIQEKHQKSWKLAEKIRQDKQIEGSGKEVNVAQQPQHVAVIHNMKSVKSMEEMQQLFEDQVVHKYEGNPGGPLNFTTTARMGLDDTGNAMEFDSRAHYAVGKDGTPSGEENALTFTSLKEWMQIKRQVTEKDQNFIDLFTTCLQGTLRRYTQFEKPKGDGKKELAMDGKCTANYTDDWTGSAPQQTAPTKLCQNGTCGACGRDNIVPPHGCVKLYVEPHDQDVEMKFVWDGEAFGQAGTAQKKTFTPPTPNTYHIEGYGRYKYLRVFQVEAPGVDVDDITISSAQDVLKGGTIKLQIARRGELEIDGENYSYPGNGIYETDLPGFSLAKRGYHFETTKNVNGTHQPLRSHWYFKPRKDCENAYKFKGRTAQCQPARLDKGILYLTARKFPAQSSEQQKDSRRRRQIEDF